ncbi:DUF2637 domain-containing protein [Streptomyces sp. bgisy032]|uniref:DUF2637 domain-containing protein n=1 Tax=Streptomyces sp. bgisy032 TaxID=3413773 RepID=UPI003D7206A9
MNTLRTRLTIAAGSVIIVLTAVAFWLSYAHLQEVAAKYGLGNSPIRSWAWPATLDLFIVAGEIMMLVAALAKRRDGWAIALTVAGSVGSIGLNVYGVGPGAPAIEYIVAAVPPTAALLAFGALMRQIHHAVAGEEAQAAPEAALEAVNDQEGTLDALPAVVLGPANGVLEVLADEDEDAEPQEFTGTPLNGTDPIQARRLDEVLADEEAQEDQPEPDEDEDEEVTTLHVVSTKPTLAEIEAAVNDIRQEKRPLSGRALAQYFGVSDRSGRRYLTVWKEAQDAA